MFLAPRYHIIAEIVSQDKDAQLMLDALPNLPVEFQKMDGEPSWSKKQYSYKRKLFALYSKLGLVRLHLTDKGDGVFVFTFTAPGFKWEFAFIAEIVYAASSIAHTLLSKGAADLTFEWRGQSAFVPYECAHRFVQAEQVVVVRHTQRVLKFAEVVSNRNQQMVEEQREDAPAPGEQLGKPKRVLH